MTLDGGRRRPRAVFVGLATLDVVHHVQARPGPDEKVTATRQFVSAGGPAANAAVAFAALGGASRLVTAIGDGPVGRLIGADLESHGVEIVDAAGPDHEAPVSAVSVDVVTGTRSVTSVDARASLATTDPSVLSGADAVLVDGHHAGLAAVARFAAADGIPLVLDAGRFKPVMAELVPYLHAVIAGADFHLPGFAPGDASAAELVARGVPLVVTTHGPHPVRWWHAGRRGSIEVPTVAQADTLGAGDAFHGAYVFQSIEDDDPLVSLRFATEVAALKCASPGPRAWLRQLPVRTDQEQ